VPKGYGPTKLLIKNAKTEKQHAKNRRTEIKILEVGKKKKK
jgi:outer membrane protein OmpA-like peptidoglycan-associated protein